MYEAYRTASREYGPEDTFAGNVWNKEPQHMNTLVYEESLIEANELLQHISVLKLNKNLTSAEVSDRLSRIAIQANAIRQNALALLGKSLA